MTSIIGSCQSFEESYGKSNDGSPRSSNSFDTWVYEFHLDSTFNYTQIELKMSSVGQIDTLAYSSRKGKYSVTNDIILIKTNDTIIQEFFRDTISNRIIDLNTMEVFASSGHFIQKIIAYNAFSKDSTYFYLPVNALEEIVIVTTDHLANHEFDLTFLRNINLINLAATSLSLKLISRLHSRYLFDSLQRVDYHCVSGWFDMSSIPWNIKIEYIENTNLISKVSHIDSKLIDGYQEFKYDEKGSLKQVDFYSSNDELINRYNIIINDMPTPVKTILK